jgi:DNA topoisomerase VI subunit A
MNDFGSTLSQHNKCRVDFEDGGYTPSSQTIEFPYELAVSSVLFIEKQGFTEVFKKSGILDELNLGLISSQGFGTRAIKKMLQDFLSRGINVYALHDCDLAGQLIGERLSGGSNTFKEKLDINLIGLTFADAKVLDKLQDAEEYESNIPVFRSSRRSEDWGSIPARR